MLLATLFHISDLHIGDIEPGTGNNPLRDEDIEWWKRFYPFDGYLGHTRVALEQVRDLYEDIVARDGEDLVHVVVTGDLSTSGSAQHFDNAWDYLIGAGADPGLALPRPPVVIAGNHDHWPGRPCTWWRALTCMLGGPAQGFDQWFPHRPIAPVAIPLANGWELRIDGLDSEEDVHAYSSERVCAIGRFHSQCGELMNTIPDARPPQQIRVLLVHHSSIHDQVAGTSTITAPSRDMLADLVRAKQIAMVLTGHTHLYASRQPGENDGIREARCGTSTSRDYFDRLQRVGPPHDRRLKRNEVLVHQLIDDAGSARWRTEVYRRGGRGKGGQFTLFDQLDFGVVAP